VIILFNNHGLIQFCIITDINYMLHSGFQFHAFDFNLFTRVLAGI